MGAVTRRSTTGPLRSAGPHGSDRCHMFPTGFGLLALFSLLSVLLGEDRRRRPDDDPELWTYGLR